MGCSTAKRCCCGTRIPPTQVDTDGDTLSDGDEVLTHGTNPARDDTDGDGLLDSEELNTHATNPLLADTDGGGTRDGQELLDATDPLDPLDDIVPPYVGPIRSGLYDMDSAIFWALAAGGGGGGGTGLVYFPAELIYVGATFGFDAITGLPTSVTDNGVVFDPGIEILLATLSWTGDYADTSEYCYIIMPLDDAPGPAPWLGAYAAPVLWYGFDWPGPLTHPAESNCDTPGYELDPVLWGFNIVDDLTTAYGLEWGVAVGEPSALVASLGLPPEYFGGRFEITTALGGVLPDVFGVAYEVDEVSMTTVDNNGDGLPDIMDPATIYPFP